MDYQALVPRALDLSLYRFGEPQQSGALTIVPVFGPGRNGRFVSPLSGLKLSQIRGYGNMELANTAESGIAIVPLHMGYIQDRAQNHALCRAAFIAPGQKLMFEDACCVQSGQGGYLEGKEQWFFILPVQLRDQALQLRGQKNYGKLWEAISRLNQQFGLPDRGHLEQIVSRSRAYLTQYQSRFELLPEQNGALFFLGDRLAGIEIAPSPAYFQELWMPLVCFCYGVAALREEQHSPPVEAAVQPFQAHSLPELRDRLRESRLARQEQVRGWLAAIPAERFERQEDERFLDLRLHTLASQSFAGQRVEDDHGLVYASLFARPQYLES